MDKIEVKASTVEKAIEEGLQELGLSSKDEAEIEILQEGGLFSKAIVNMQKKETPQDIVINFLNGLFERMSLRCYADCEVKDDELRVNISGSDSGVIIGYRGEVLDAIQYFALILVNEKGHNFIRVTINAENYREKREQTLESLANRLAYKAYRTGKKIELEPMNPFERRIIHTSLHESKFATTESEGDDLNRHIVIIPKEGGVREGSYDRDYNRDRKYNRPNRDRSHSNYNRQYKNDNTDETTEATEERNVEINLKKNGPPKFKSYGYPKRRF